MAKIGLVIKPGIDAAVAIGKEIIAWAKPSKHKIIIDPVSAQILSDVSSQDYVELVPTEKIAAKADPIVTLGGDGTLIGVGRYVSEKSPAMIGVNFGVLGFLTEILPGEIFDTLERALNGTCVYAERSMLLAEIHRQGQKIFTSQAVNDAVVQKGVRDRLLDLDLSVGGEEVMRLRGDGIIIATPTGSTAYSLSAGGSIVFPSLEVALITPICPHSLTNRPLILNLDSEIQVSVPSYDGKVFLIIDGQVSTPLMPGDALTIRRSKNLVRFVRSQRKSYFGILRTKLNWGLGNKSE